MPNGHVRQGGPAESAAAILGRIRAGLPGGGEARPGQVTMAEAVETTIDQGGVLFVQAGTGQGKSLAYTSGAVASGQTTVVATSSIALQDQLTRKDLPLVAAQLAGEEFSYAVLKGRSNYACLRAIADVMKSEGGPKQERILDVAELEEDGVDADQIASIIDWVGTTETGDKAELPFEPSYTTWGAVSRTSETCPGKRDCKFGEACFAEQARERAKHVDVLVVNTHLYALHVGTDGAILPPHTAVVFDEAHELEPILSSALGSEFGAGHLRALARETKRILDDDRVTGTVEAAARELAGAVDELAHPNGMDKPAEDVRLRGGAESSPRLSAALAQAANAVGLVQVGLRNVPDTGSEKAQSRKKKAQLTASSVMQKLRDVSVDDDGTVVWTEGSRHIKTAPVNVGKVLDEWFWTAIGEDLPADSFRDDEDESDEDEQVARPPRSVVFTSATLPVSLPQRLHAPDPVQMDVGSPFDFRANAVLYVPAIPDPKSDPVAWKAAAHQEMRDLIMAAGGRTLALFTSTAAMREAAEAVGSGIPYRVLVQGGDLPKRRLVEEFSTDHETCLFATRSFFQGVDIPGQTLSLVILDRIPFPRPGDPLIEAWQEEAGGGWAGFSKVCIPLAGTSLAQAAGRLIRSADDRGVVAILDSRLAEAAYRSSLLATVPPMRRRRNKAEVLEFLASVVAPSAAPVSAA